jgi:hypothetical protein
LPPGHIVVTAVTEMSLEDITPALARRSGFVGVVDLLKTAKHGPGRRVFLIEFRYEAQAVRRYPRRAIVVVSLAVGLLPLGCFRPKRTPVTYEVPRGYVGWVRIEFEQPRAAPLPRRDGNLVIRIPPSGVLRTSSPFEVGWARDRYVAYSAQGVTELPLTGWGAGGMIWGQFNGTGTGEHGRTHEMFFVGSEAAYQESVASRGVPEDATSSYPTPGSSKPLAE